MEREDTAYQRKQTLAQYLYETTGDATGFRGLGAYTDEQIAALSAQAIALRVQGSGSGRNGGGTSGDEVPKKSNPITSYSQLGSTARKIADGMSRIANRDNTEMIAAQIENGLRNGSISEEEADFLLRALGT